MEAIDKLIADLQDENEKLKRRVDVLEKIINDHLNNKDNLKHVDQLKIEYGL